ncbi:MAG: PAN domain-containing protein [Mycobacteriaceae bacterium]
MASARVFTNTIHLSATCHIRCGKICIISRTKCSNHRRCNSFQYRNSDCLCTTMDWIQAFSLTEESSRSIITTLRNSL